MNTFIAVPHYGDISANTAFAMVNVVATGQGNVYIESRGGSLLPDNFNGLWCKALNNRPFDKFVMLHSDVAPLQHNWLELLIAEQEACGADMLSVVIPIKDRRGLTSTGLIDPNTGRVQRFTMNEVYGDNFPRTFSIDSFIDAAPQVLAVNTGLWVCNFDKPWVEEVAFRIQSDIVRRPDGKFQPVSIPEDWDFSLQLASLGLKVFATTKISVLHKGSADFSNDHPWGTLTKDVGDDLTV